MSTDIEYTRKELKNHKEINLPYDFPIKCHIKYITSKEGKEYFYKGGEYISFGNNCIWLTNRGISWSVPILLLNSDGSIKYSNHFYILDEENTECDEDKNELESIISYQQSIIEKQTKTISELEVFVLRYILSAMAPIRTESSVVELLSLIRI